MKVILSHKIALNPTPKQENVLLQAVGCSRFAFNWALSEWKSQYEAGGQPSERELRRLLNARKAELFPWMLSVPKSVVQQAIKNVGIAFDRFFKKTSRFPRFKKKGVHDSARFDNGPGTFACNEKRIRLTKLGWVKMREALRFNGRPLSAVVSRECGRWFVSVAVEIDHAVPKREPSSVGVDLGIATDATLSTGEKLNGPKSLKSSLRELRSLNRHLSRKIRGSRNHKKCKSKLTRCHARIKHIRSDWLHKTTTRIVRRFSLVGIESLNVAGMMKNRRLSRSISDVGFYEFRRQLEYKAELYGSKIVAASVWFPSTKTCSVCGDVIDKLPLSIREWTCRCGSHHDRDVNAAVNLRDNAASCVANTPVERIGSGRKRKPATKPSAVKQGLALTRSQ